MHLYLFREDTTFAEVTGRVFMGRALECELLLPFDDRVARRHAKVSREADSFFIEDLGSTHGVFLVNHEHKQLTRPHRIMNEDTFMVGSSRVKAMLRVDALETPATRAAADEAAAHPGDPAPRAVWTDLLLERADPLGAWLGGEAPDSTRWPAGAKLTWGDRLIRKLKLTRAIDGIGVLRSRLACQLLELTIDLEDPEDPSAAGFFHHLAATSLPALRVVRSVTQTRVPLPRALPLAPRLVTLES